MDFNVCKNCNYYSGIKCHGHGDFWGECKIINCLPNREIFDSIVYDETKCKLNDDEIVFYYEKEIKKMEKKINTLKERLKIHRNEVKK